MDMTELIRQALEKLEGYAIQGLELGKDMVMKEVAYRIWLNQLGLRIAIVLFSISAAMMIFGFIAAHVGRDKRDKSLFWSDCTLMDGTWELGLFITGSLLLITSTITFLCTFFNLRHFEMNPIWCVIKALLP